MNWLERKQATLARLARRYGADWVEQHRDGLDEQWRHVADLQGFDPETGEAR